MKRTQLRRAPKPKDRAPKIIGWNGAKNEPILAPPHPVIVTKPKVKL